jgi:enamine deaminase RidA (YjgF/YER057c/UK114 family)
MNNPTALRVLVTVCFVALPVSPVMAAEVTILEAPGAAARDLPFSEAVRVGDTIYLSGQLGV